MNQLLLEEPKLYIADNGHPYFESGFAVVPKRVTCLIDTGFSLGFAFSQKSVSKFNFKNGYMITMLLGNGMPTKGMAFIVDVLIKKAGCTTPVGQASVVFMDKGGEPLLGIEVLKLLSPLTMDWKTQLVTSAVTA